MTLGCNNSSVLLQVGCVMVMHILDIPIPYEHSCLLIMVVCGCIGILSIVMSQG